MNPRLGITRNIIRPDYALITPDGYVASVLPGWTGGTIGHVIISSEMGADLVQLLLKLDKTGRGDVQTGEDEWFFYVLSGKGILKKEVMTAGNYAYVPPGSEFTFVSKAENTHVLVFKKFYEPIAGEKTPSFFIKHEDTIPKVDYMGDPHARLQTLLPDSMEADMAVNIFTYDPGATLPFVETHIMEHGMMFLSGSGVYRLGDDWHPVQAGDSIWIAPYCPQWFIAGGPSPARYIYYKNINRNPV